MRGGWRPGQAETQEKAMTLPFAKGQQSMESKLQGSKKIGKKEQRRKTQRRRTVLDDFPILMELR